MTMAASMAPDVARGSPREPGAPAGIDGVRLARLRWRCRRGMLENDLVLTRFLDARGADLTEGELAQLDALLDLSDHDLWDVLAGRTAPADPSLAPLVAALASPAAVPPSRTQGGTEP
jgi:antitoxin CptB